MQQNRKNNLRVLVLQGGSSSEREVSLRSAECVVNALTEIGCTVISADPAEPDFDLVSIVRSCDVVFPVLHGSGGEDGMLQKQLEALHIPFLGTGSVGCELTFNKAEYREFVAKNNGTVAKGQVVDLAGFIDSNLRAQPYVLKPYDGGSSIDTFIVRDLSNAPDMESIQACFTRHPHMLLEQLVEGQEITIGVLGDTALPVISITPPEHGEFDYENKYNGQTTEQVDPSTIPLATKQAAQALALQIHTATGCRHMSRTDMIITPSNEVVILETNTIPGLTNQSLYPKAALAAGYDMPALCTKWLELIRS